MERDIRKETETDRDRGNEAQEKRKRERDRRKETETDRDRGKEVEGKRQKERDRRKETEGKRKTESAMANECETEGKH